MSSALRAPSWLWNNVAGINNSTAAKASSAGANVGIAANVALFIKVSGACVLKLQASAPTSPTTGRNAIPATDGTAEASWYDYHDITGLDVGGTSDAAVSITFAGPAQAVINMSPFAPPFLRLVRTDAAADVTITAFVTALG